MIQVACVCSVCASHRLVGGCQAGHRLYQSKFDFFCKLVVDKLIFMLS